VMRAGRTTKDCRDERSREPSTSEPDSASLNQ
jgi:hypothetical protein